MKRKLLAFTLVLAMVFVFFGVACGGERGESSSGTGSSGTGSSLEKSEDVSAPEIDESSSVADESVESSENISAPEEDETLLARELFPWIETLATDNVISVKREFGYIGVAPDSPTDIKQSSERVDIERILTYLKTLTVTAIPTEDGQIAGGSGVELAFFTQTEEYRIYVGNGNVYVDGRYYRVNERVPELSVENA